MREDVVLPNENDARNLLLIAYALFFAGWLTGGMTSIVGVIICYVKRDEYFHTWLGTHVNEMIKVFWWSFWVALLGGILIWILIGWLVLLLLFIWNMVKLIKGVLKLWDRKSI